MLSLTDNACSAIRAIADSRELPESSGIRISSASPGEPGRLTLSTAEEASEGDQTVEANGARVFLDASAANVLGNSVLDAARDEKGRFTFSFAQRG
jgi:Fe-S cluster assembly iron-binding protein IscA